MSNLFFNSILKGVANFQTFSGLIWVWVYFLFFVLFFFSLINSLFISTLALSILWSLQISTLDMTSQFLTIFRSEDSTKSVWFLVTPPGASHVQYLLAAFKKSEFVKTRLFSSAKSRSLPPPPPSHFCCLFQRVLCICFHFYFLLHILTYLALNSPITMWWLQAVLSIHWVNDNTSKNIDLMVQPIKLNSNKCDFSSVKLNSWAVPSYQVARNMTLARGKRSMCCTWFAHDCARATWAYVLETVRGSVRFVCWLVA